VNPYHAKTMYIKMISTQARDIIWEEIQIMESKAHEIDQAYIMGIILWGKHVMG
jgi:hypothetical protein